MSRQVVLDTETTGLDPSQGHRIIEIGCIELINRKFTGNNYHTHINPERKVDAGAVKVHGITNTFLENKPRFAEVYQELRCYIDGAELIIHNAPFDVGFLNHEFLRLDRKNASLESICKIFDTLQLARKTHPGQRNSLDALCKRYKVDNSNRKLHGALLDAEILAKVYLAMTGGQSSLFDLPDTSRNTQSQPTQQTSTTISAHKKIWELPVVEATADELKADQEYFE